MYLFNLAQVTGYDLFYELFLSEEPWGYLGIMGILIFGYVLAKKDKVLGLVWYIIEWLFLANYLSLVEATPFYWWHIIILLIGGFATCVFPLIDR